MTSNLQKSFWRLFTPVQAQNARKFTLDELRELYGVLIRNPVVTEANRALVVETIREVAEYMIWGDQNEPRIFDFFLENNVMTYLHRILLQPANRKGDVARQVLQTLGIIIQNVRSQTAIFFLFSNNHVNNIVDLDFDFEDEEVLGYYISFLKTISLKLNRGTVQFFFDTSGDATVSFPLYTRAVTLAHHKEGMVRAAVRTLTLNVYSVNDPYIQSFVTSPPAVRYFADVAGYLAEQVQLLDRRMAAAEGGSVQALNSLDSQLAEVEDVLSYCSDTLNLGVPSIAHMMAESLWKAVIGPLLLKSLLESGQPDAAAGLGSAVAAALAQGSPAQGSPAAGQGHMRRGSWSNSPSSKRLFTGTPDGSGSPVRPTTPSTPARVRPVCAVFVLERIFQLVMYGPLVHQTLLALLAGDPGSSIGSSKDALDVAEAAAAGGGAVERGPGQVDNTDATASTSQADGSSSRYSRQSGLKASLQGQGVSTPTCRRTLLDMLSGEQMYPAVMALRLLVAVLLNRHLSAALLSALGILPRRRQQQQDSGANSSSGEVSSDAEARVLLQVCLQQLQQRQEPESGGSGGKAGSSSGLAAMLTGAYLAAQLQELVVGGKLPVTQSAAARSPSPVASPTPAAGLSPTSAAEAATQPPAAAPPTAAAPAAASQDPLPIPELERADSAGVEAIAAVFGGVREQLVDALFALLQAQGLPAAGLWWLGWLLHQLLPVATPETAGVAGLGEAGAALTDVQQAQLQRVCEAAQGALLGELGGMWCEAVFAIMSLEWLGAREGLLRPVLRASSEGLLSGAHVHSLLLEQQQRHLASAASVQNGVLPGSLPSPRGCGGLEAALSGSARAALVAYRAVQRVVALRQLHELLTIGVVSKAPPVPVVSEAELKQVDIQEGYTVDLAPGSAIPCVVSFAPGQERRVFFAVAGLSLRNRAAATSPVPGSAAARTQASALLKSLPVAVLADPVAGKSNQGVVLSVAPLLGADPLVDKNVAKWLHVHVRPSVRGLLRVLKTAVVKKGGLLTSMRQLADGHWVLAFPDADRAAAARSLTHKHTNRLRALYSEALRPLLSGEAAALLAVPDIGDIDGASESGPASSVGGDESAARGSMEQQQQQPLVEPLQQEQEQEEWQEGQELKEIRRPTTSDQQQQEEQQHVTGPTAHVDAEMPLQRQEQHTDTGVGQAPLEEASSSDQQEGVQVVPLRQYQVQHLDSNSASQQQQLPEEQQQGHQQQALQQQAQQQQAHQQQAQQQQAQQQQAQQWQQQDEGGWSGSETGDDPLATMSELSLQSGQSAGSSLIAAAAGSMLSGALTLDAMPSAEGWPSEAHAAQSGAGSHEHHNSLT